MAAPFTCSLPPPSAADPATGFCRDTKTFHSLRPAVPLPPKTLPLSFPSFALSLLPSPLPSHPALIDAATGVSVSYPSFVSQVHSLSHSLHTHLNLSKGDVAFILSPSSLDVPILYFALLSLGAVLSPANTLSSPSEISRQIKLVNPSAIFATSNTVSKLPLDITATVVLLDSPEFRSFVAAERSDFRAISNVTVNQTDPAVIQFSSGTTGRIKAAALPHRSFIAMTAGFHALRTTVGEVTLLVAPMFHSLGFFFTLNGVAMGETTVVMSKVGFAEILGAAERYRATLMTASPPVVVAMARSEEVGRYDLGALETVLSGGAPLSLEAAKTFMARFPRVQLRQGYGSTEAGGVSRMINHEECRHLRSVGRLTENVEAKVVDTVTGKPLSVGQQGELWVRGPAVMIGYVGDDEANASAFHSEGWLKTGDLCYFDNDGFLYIVDRLKELIKYKAYQVPPAELEHLLCSLPEIADAAVIPYPQEEVGQIPMAFVVRQPGSSLSGRQVMDYVAKQVAPYKKIRRVTEISSREDPEEGVKKSCSLQCRSVSVVILCLRIFVHISHLLKEYLKERPIVYIVGKLSVNAESSIIHTNS